MVLFVFFWESKDKDVSDRTLVVCAKHAGDALALRDTVDMGDCSSIRTSPAANDSKPGVIFDSWEETWSKVTTEDLRVTLTRYHAYAVAKPARAEWLRRMGKPFARD